MSFEIITQPDDGRGDLIADRALYTDDAHVLLLESGDPRSGVLLAIGEGARIPAEFVRQLDLVMVDGRVQIRGAVKERAASADKQLKGAAKSKSADAKA